MACKKTAKDPGDQPRFRLTNFPQSSLHLEQQTKEQQAEKSFKSVVFGSLALLLFFICAISGGHCESHGKAGKMLKAGVTNLFATERYFSDSE